MNERAYNLLRHTIKVNRPIAAEIYTVRLKIRQGQASSYGK